MVIVVKTVTAVARVVRAIATAMTVSADGVIATVLFEKSNPRGIPTIWFGHRFSIFR